jgi:hypothetical protein
MRVAGLGVSDRSAAELSAARLAISLATSASLFWFSDIQLSSSSEFVGVAFRSGFGAGRTRDPENTAAALCA